MSPAVKSSHPQKTQIIEKEGPGREERVEEPAPRGRARKEESESPSKGLQGFESRSH